MDQRLRNKLILSMKRCIVVRFTPSDWDELAYLTNGHDIIHNHPRLLRSLYFGDDDYDGHIFEVLESLISQDISNLQIIIDYLDLPEYLKENSPKEFEELYGHTQPLLDGLEDVAITNSFELNQHILRIRRAIESDPELAVGSTKEMVESVLKNILEANGETVEREELPQLLKRTQKILKLDPSDIAETARGAELIKRTLSNLGQVITGIGELRNLYGTGHGRSRQSGISPRHARLVVNAGTTLAVFLMETFEHHQNKK